MLVDHGGDYVENLSYVAIRCSSFMFVHVRRLTKNAPPAPHRAHILQPSVCLQANLSLFSSGIMNTRNSSNNGGNGATGGVSSPAAAAAAASAVVGGFAAIAQAISAGAAQSSPVVTPPTHKRKEPEPGPSAGSTEVSRLAPAVSAQLCLCLRFAL